MALGKVCCGRCVALYGRTGDKSLLISRIGALSGARCGGGISYGPHMIQMRV